MWTSTLTPAVPFSPLSPSLTLMDPKTNNFWSRTSPQNQPRTPPLDEIYSTPDNSLVLDNLNGNGNESIFTTPLLQSQLSNCSVGSDVFGTPESTLDSDDVFSGVELRKHETANKITNMSTINENVSENSFVPNTSIRSSLREMKPAVRNVFCDGVIRSKSDFEIPIKNNKSQGFLHNIHQKSDQLFNNITLLSPLSKRRTQSSSSKVDIGKQSTPLNKHGANNSHVFKLPGSPILNVHPENCGTRAISLNSLRHSGGEHIAQQINNQQLRFVHETNILFCVEYNN